MKLSKYVKKGLDERGINFKQAGKIVGISPEYVSGICKGKIPSENILKRMSRTLGLDLQAMIKMRIKEKAHVDIFALDESPVFSQLKEVWTDMKDLPVAQQKKLIQELAEKVKALLQ
jgi:transcriptional regulator with XRE-family HTH domain